MNDEAGLRAVGLGDGHELARRAAALLSVCPYCRGQGTVPYNGDWSDPDAEMVDCLPCGGTGNLLARWIAQAYSRGRHDALSEAVSMLDQTTQALARPAPQHVTARSLVKEITGQ